MLSTLKQVFVLCILLYLSGCGDTTESISDDLTPGRRDYVWHIDTLKLKDDLNITRMWGSSPKDVWAIGSSSWTCGQIWHYDGYTWRHDSISRPISATALWGFSETDVWLGTAHGAIWRFDGRNWRNFCTFTFPGYDRIAIINFFGKSADDFYAVGFAENTGSKDFKGFIMHFDGKNWLPLDIPSIKIAFCEGAIDRKTGAIIIAGLSYETDGTFIENLLSINGREINELSTADNISITEINGEVLIVIEQKVFKYKNDSVELIINKTGSEYLGKVWGGRSCSDFFWGANRGMGHFNGSDFQLLYDLPLDIAAFMIFEKDVFFVHNNFEAFNNNIVMHGVLK